MNLCGLCERDLEAAVLCAGCTLATVERLTALPDLYRALATFLPPSASGPRIRVSTSRGGAPMPVAEEPLILRGPGGMVAVVEDWRSALHADLGWSEPRRHGSFEERLARAVKGVRDNILFIAEAWPVAGAFAEEIRDLYREARSVVDPPEKTIRLGSCPAVYEDGTLCGAALRVPAGAAEVVCRWCGTGYPPNTWLELRAAQGSFEGEAIAPNPRVRVG